MGWSASSEHESKAIMHLSQSDDHTAAIMAATIVEARLRQALETRFQRNEKIEHEMFRTSGPLGSFSAKIKMAFLIGIINEETHRDLDIFKDVRNRFAHRVDVTDFRSSNIKSLTDRLSLIEKHFEEITTPGVGFANIHKKDLMMNMEGLAEKLADPRWRYLMTAMLLTTALLFPHGDKPLVR